MTWSRRFEQALSETGNVPRFVLQTIVTTDGVTAGVAFATSDGISATTMIRGNAGTLPIIAEDGVRVQGSRLSLREWTMRLGGFTVDIVCPDASFMSQLSRGAIFELRCGFQGFGSGEFETIAIGQLVNVTRSGIRPRWTLQFRDILSALQSRWSTTTDQQQLFYSLGTTTTVSTAYTAGTGGSLEVASTANFDAPTGYNAALKVSTTGGDWYTTYTGTTAGPPVAFTGLPTGDLFGTAQTNAAVSDVVTDVARLYGAPLEIMASILTSTGGGTNGSFDIYPKSWGYGLPVRFVDVADITTWTTRSEPPAALGGGKQIDLIVDGAQANGLSWLTAWMSAVGCWPVMRQGKISGRPIMPGGIGVYTTITATPVPVVYPIGAGEIIEVLSWEAFHPDYPGEYASVTASGLSLDGTSARTSTAKSEAISHLPSLNTIDLALPGAFGSASDNFRNAARDRMAEWLLRIPERIRLRTRTLYHARLAPGDHTLLFTDLLSGRLAPTGYNRRRCIVTEVSPDWTGASTVLELAVLPDKANEFD